MPLPEVQESAPRHSSPGVTLCVINYNGERYLRDTLKAALAVTGSGRFADTVFVDDASTDGSLDLVRREFPDVHPVRLPRNQGAAAARNAALERARTARVLMLDNDVVLTPGCVSSLQDALDRNTDAAAAMPRVVYADHPEIVQFDGAESHFIGLQTVIDADGAGFEPGATRPRRVGSLISACFLLDRARAGADLVFDESFFIYLEDHDFGLRIRAAGWNILSVPTAVVHHDAGTPGLSIRQLGHYSKQRVFCLIRNRWQVLLKNYSMRTLWLLCPALLLFEFAQFVMVVRKGWLREWLRAVLWMGTHVGDVLAKRRETARRRTVADRELLSAGAIPLRADLTGSLSGRLAKAFLDRVVSGWWSLVESRL